MRSHFVALFVAAAAGVALYLPVVSGLVRQWLDDSDSSYGIFLVAAALIVLRRRWTALRAIPIDGRDGGFAVVAVALLIYTLGTVGADVFLPRISLPLAIAGGLMFLCGAHHLRLCIAPVALLLLAIPLPGVLLTYLTMPLQLASSQVAAATLEAVQIDVVREGNILTLPHITLQVVEACSGLRSVVSLVSVAAVCAAVLSLRSTRTMMLLASAIPIAVIGNGLRVATAGVLTKWVGEAGVRGPLHEATGFVAFLVMCAGVLALHVLTRSRPVTLSTVREEAL